MLDVLTKTGRYNAALFTLPTAKITAMLPLWRDSERDVFLE
jgi:hypothetical protein